MNRLRVSFVLVAMALGLPAGGAGQEDADTPPRWTAAEREQIGRALKATTIEAVKTTPQERAEMKRRGKRVLLYRGTPRYPKEQAEHRVEGCVLMTFRIRPDGKTDDFAITKSYPAGVFDDLAIRSVFAMEFEPAATTDEYGQLFTFVMGPDIRAGNFFMNEHERKKLQHAQARLNEACNASKSTPDGES